MVRIILPELGEHSCDLPWSSSGYGSTGKPVGTLVQCERCRRWWVCVPCYQSLGPTERWVLVRWYHRRLKRRIEEMA